MSSLRLLVPVLLASALQLSAQLDQGLLAFVPANSKVVVGFDVQKAKTSGIGQFFLSHRKDNSEQFDQFVTQTGFDPRRDLQYVIIAGNGPKSSGIILARGSFDVAKIEAAATAKGDQIESVAGKDALVIKGGTQMIAFPRFGVAIAGDPAIVRSILTTPTPTTLDPALVALVRSASTQNDFWMASTLPPSSIPAITSREKTFANAQTLQSIQQVSGGIQFTDPVQISFNAVTRSPQDANSLADVVRFASEMLQTHVQNDPKAAPLAPALQDVAIAANGPDLHVALAVPEQTFEQLLQNPRL